jgi:hypothetical protein
MSLQQTQLYAEMQLISIFKSIPTKLFLELKDTQFGLLSKTLLIFFCGPQQRYE